MNSLQSRLSLKHPLIVAPMAGGIMTADDIRTACRAGADAVQMGTAFLVVKEAGTGNAYRKKLLESPDRETKTTRAFSGRLARGINNRFMTEIDADHGHSSIPRAKQVHARLAKRFGRPWIVRFSLTLVWHWKRCTMDRHHSRSD